MFLAGSERLTMNIDVDQSKGVELYRAIKLFDKKSHIHTVVNIQESSLVRCLLVRMERCLGLIKLTAEKRDSHSKTS